MVAKYFIAIPSGPSMPTHTAISLSKLTSEMREQGIEYETSFEIGNCHVDDARNILVSRFLRSDSTHLVFIDSDIVFKPKDFFDLVGFDTDVVGATYPYKNDSSDFPCSFRSGTTYPDDETGLVPVAGLPTGFLKISRTAFERLKPHMPSYKLVNEPGIEVTQFFDRSIRDGFNRVKHGLRIGGDISFCYDMTQLAGIDCLLAPKIVLGHTGSKTWTGSVYWKQSIMTRGVYTSFHEAYKDGSWDNSQCLDTVQKQWGNEVFAGDANYLKACVFLLREHSNKPCLEMGGGLSTLFLALAAEEKGTHVTSLEQDRAWMGKTWGLIDDVGLLDYVDVVHAKAEDGHYDISDEIAEKKYGLVVVDGPKCTYKSLGRAQAAEFDADCFLFDDAQRPAIQKTIKTLEDKGYHSHILGDIATRPIVVCVRKEFTKEV